jgi:hypothetical protein
VAFAYVTAPLWHQPGRAVDRSTKAQGLDELTQERNVILRTLRDLDFDYQLGKLSDTDYRMLRAQYVAQGVAIYRELDASIGADPIEFEDEIETEVQRRRSNLPTQTCSECGAMIVTDSRFCAQCGKRL